MDRKRSFRSPPSGLPKRNDSILPELGNFSLKKDLQKSSSKNVKLFDPIRESTQSEFKEESTTNEYGDYISISQFSVAPKQQSKSNSLSRSKSVSIRTPSLDGKNDKIIKSVSTNEHASPWRLLKTKLALIPNLPTLDLNKENIRANSITPKKRFTLYNIHRQESDKDEIVAKEIYEPTYRLEPVNKFDRHKAEDIIHDAIKYFLENIFSVESMALKSSVKTSIEHLSTTIKSKIKLIADKRYKIIVNSTICEEKYQGIMIASKCLWDQEHDVAITVKETYKNFIILVNVFAVYHD